MWYMCRRSEKQQINIPGKDFPWDTSWKVSKAKDQDTDNVSGIGGEIVVCI